VLVKFRFVERQRIEPAFLQALLEFWPRQAQALRTGLSDQPVG
jgi:hypothetical protein